VYARIIGQHRHHYERAFAAFLRSRRVPHISVNEAQRTPLPDAGPLSALDAAGVTQRGLKSFDFVIYGSTRHLLAEIKGRKIALGNGRSPRLESWVTRDDVESLNTWGELFAEPFDPAFVFVYWCEAQPPDALFQEIFEHQGRWYAIRAIRVADYITEMKTRSERWGTVHLPTQAFARLSRPFAPRRPHPEHEPLTPAIEGPLPARAQPTKPGVLSGVG